jgi:hypothetical protein
VSVFAQLAALGREEHALVTDGRYDELPTIHERRMALIAALPPRPPADAMDDLREATRLQALITVTLREARDATAAQLVQLRRTRRGVQGYAAGTGVRIGAAPAFDQRH